MAKQLSVFTMSVTPFDNEGRFNEPAFRRHLRRLASVGVGVYVAGSGSGEGYALTTAEVEQMLGIASAELKGKVPVRAMGTEPHLPREMVDFVKRAGKFDLDAIHVYSLEMGHGGTPSRAELDRYYKTAMDATDGKPVVLSTHRAAGYIMPIDLLEQLVSRYPNVVDFAYGGADLKYLAAVIKRVGDRIDVHCSGCRQALTTLALGGNGFMGHEGNLVPELTLSVINAFRDMDHQLLQESFAKLIAFNTMEDKHGGSVVRALKPLLNAYGFEAGQLRPPRLPITDAELRDVIDQVVAMDIPELRKLTPVKPQ